MAIHLIGGYQTDFARAWSREGLDYTDMMREGIDGEYLTYRIGQVARLATIWTSWVSPT